jgi:hypothetical protein
VVKVCGTTKLSSTEAKDLLETTIEVFDSEGEECGGDFCETGEVQTY